VTDTEPRIAPIPRDTLPDDVRVALQGWLRPDATEVPAPLDTLARHPDLARSYLAFNRHLLFESTLTHRASGRGSTTKRSLARRMGPTPPAGLLATPR
jgi:hypothetical protein